MPGQKVLTSIGAGPYGELLDLSGRSFERYAERHGYDLELRRELPAPERPPSWSRIPLILDLFERYELVVWIDADAAVVDHGTDIADELPARALLGMVAHEVDGQRIPNCGVWVLRRHRRVARFLEAVWRQTEFLEHRWWENAAVLHLLGYEVDPAVELRRPARLLRRVHFLDPSWNSMELHPSPHPRINHYPGRPLDYRLEHLRADVASLTA